MGRRIPPLLLPGSFFLLGLFCCLYIFFDRDSPRALSPESASGAVERQWLQMLDGNYDSTGLSVSEAKQRRGDGVPEDVAFVMEGVEAPTDFINARCIDQYGDDEFCKFKIDHAHHAIGVWRPPGRQSSMLWIYKGSCLDAGCVLQNPDAGYPEQYRGTTTLVSWRGQRGGLVLRQSQRYEFEIVSDEISVLKR